MSRVEIAALIAVLAASEHVWLREHARELARKYLRGGR
jgi:hypothetical protein